MPRRNCRIETRPLDTVSAGRGATLALPSGQRFPLIIMVSPHQQTDDRGGCRGELERVSAGLFADREQGGRCSPYQVEHGQRQDAERPSKGRAFQSLMDSHQYGLQVHTSGLRASENQIQPLGKSSAAEMPPRGRQLDEYAYGYGQDRMHGGAAYASIHSVCRVSWPRLSGASLPRRPYGRLDEPRHHLASR